jgi:hypothetical protein
LQQVNWCRLLPFPFLVPPLLRLTSPHHRTMSHFLSMEPRRARWLRFILSPPLRLTSPHRRAMSHFLSMEPRRARWLRFILSPPLSSRNKKVLNPHHCHRSTSLNRPTLTLYCYKKVISTFDLSPHHSIVSPFYLLPSQSTTSSELHTSPWFPFTSTPHLSSLRTTTR